MRVILDTPVIIELLKPYPSEKVLNFFNKSQQLEIFSSVFTFAEISKKIKNLPGSNKKKNLELWLVNFLEDFQNQILSIDFESALYFELSLKEIASENKYLDLSFFINLSLSYSKKIPLVTYIETSSLPFVSDAILLNLYEFT